jgi:hypothetical protein
MVRVAQGRKRVDSGRLVRSFGSGISGFGEGRQLKEQNP